MLWLLLSLLSGLSQSSRDLFSKKVLQNLDEYIVNFSRSFFSFLCYIPFLFFIEIPTLDSYFWLIILVNGGIVSVALFLYVKAIKLSPLSITIPMLAFTPLFLLLTSPLIIGEYASFWGFIGILMIVLGAYILGIKDVQKGFLAPFKSLIKEKGALLMLIVSFLFGIGANVYKIGVQLSTPLVFSTASEAFVMSIFLFLMLLRKSKQSTEGMRVHLRTLFVIGLFHALQNIFFMTALEIALVAYVISIRRTSIVFSTLYGFVFFKEKHTKNRLTGALFMLTGVILISLF